MRHLALAALLAVSIAFPPPQAAAAADAYLSAFRAYKERDYDGAVDGFRRAIVENPENFMAYWWLANVYIEQRLYGKAKNIVSIADRVKLPEARLPEEAFDDRRRLLASGREAERRRARGEELHRAGRRAVADGKWADAVAAFREATGIDPLEPRHQAALGDALLDSGRPEEACDAYLRASLLAPGDAKTLRKLADCEERLGRGEEALASLRALHRIAPDPSLPPRIRALAEARLVRSAHRVLKRRGDSVYLDIGYAHGLAFGDEFKTKLRIVRTDRERAVNDLETGAPIGLEAPRDVGDAMVVRIEDDWCEARVTGEWNEGIRVGDEVAWQSKKNGK